MKIYESSPWGALSDKLKRECTDYVSSQFYPDVITGSYKEGIRCENLEKMTFGDESFDLVIRQDVLEHVLNPALAFKEISRILKPTGVHVFTIPYYSTKKTIVRAGQTSDGIKYLKEPMFHDSQSDEKGSLVVTEWGNDVLDLIFRYSGMKTIIYDKFNSEMGLNVESLEVFIGTKI